MKNCQKTLWEKRIYNHGRMNLNRQLNVQNLKLKTLQIQILMIRTVMVDNTTFLMSHLFICVFILNNDSIGPSQRLRTVASLAIHIDW